MKKKHMMYQKGVVSEYKRLEPKLKVELSYEKYKRSSRLSHRVIGSGCKDPSLRLTELTSLHRERQG